MERVAVETRGVFGEVAMRFLGLAVAVVETAFPYVMLASAVICLGTKAISDEIEYKRWERTSGKRS